jgi:hypothetical protein
LKATMGGSGIRGHWTYVETNSKLSKIFPEPPMVAFKQPNSLRNLLVWAEIFKPNTTIGKSHSCGDKRCKCCRHMQHSSSYTNKVTGKQYKLELWVTPRLQYYDVQTLEYRDISTLIISPSKF